MKSKKEEEEEDEDEKEERESEAGRNTSQGKQVSQRRTNILIAKLFGDLHIFHFKVSKTR